MALAGAGGYLTDARQETTPDALRLGLDMYYEVHGDGSPLLLLHGGAGSIPEKWIPLFTPHFRVIAPEQMGHGRTADLVDRAFHYHDMAVHHPERVTKLAVTGANARFAGYTAENREFARSFDPASQPVSESYARLSPNGPQHWPVVLGRLKPMWEAEPSLTNEQLQSIEAPTLLIIGDRDIVTPEHAVEMFRTIPRAQLCVVPNAAHGVMPKEAILRFLQEEAASAK